MFNKETGYAFRGLAYIYRRNKEGLRPGVVEVANCIEAPRFFTAKILQRLVRLGFLSSMKGKGGGFFLDGDKPDRSLKDIVVAIEGQSTFEECIFGFTQCNTTSPCPMHHQYEKIKRELNELVATETIRMLAEKQSD